MEGSVVSWPAWKSCEPNQGSGHCGLLATSQQTENVFGEAHKHVLLLYRKKYARNGHTLPTH